MREIKFRAFIKNLDDIDKRIPSTPDKVNDHFVYGNLVKSAYNTDDSDLILSDQDDNELLNWQQSIPKDTAEEYTGLNDKNGNDIYEGDIIQFSYNGDKYYAKIIFQQGSFIGETDTDAIPNVNLTSVAVDKGYYFTSPSNHCCDICIAGNVHENPELLKA